MKGPSLYGIENSNRSKKDFWGKNQFNSAFPVSLCCYMRDNEISPVYIAVNADFSHRTKDDEICIADVFGTPKLGNEIRFEFESTFNPFQKFLYDKLGGIDLVTKDSTTSRFLRPLEVKLTVIPDSATFNIPDENLWGSELVIRPATSSYAALNIYKSIGKNDDARNILEPQASKISDWNNQTEIISHKEEIIQCLKEYLKIFHTKQKPFLMQPVWKTMGKSPMLAENCFDVFVWSDFAICKAFIDFADNSKSKKVTRAMRECARMLRCLNDLHTKDKVNVGQIYKGMSLGAQTDKAVALNGQLTNTYMSHPRLENPILTRDILKKIILNGGENLLSPERRFDATIYFTCRELLSDTDIST